MESAGARLKKIRLEKGISLEDLQKKTKVHLNILKAIEDDSLVNVSPVYIKGFLKIYCKFLGVNPQDYISDYKEPQSTASLEKIKTEREEAASSLFKDVFGKIEAFRPSLRLKKLIVVILGIVIALILLFSLGKFIALNIAKKINDSKVASYIAQKPTAHRGKLDAPKEQVKKTTAPAQVNTIKATSGENSLGIRLGIRAKEDCFAQVKIDGKLIFQNVLRRGRFESWQAKEKIQLSLGNAGSVVLEVNGKVIPNIGRRNQSINNIVITREGLSIPR